MALEWVNKVNGVDENDADDVNTLAAAIKENETAIAGKVDKEAGKQLSSNDYTTEEKNKLAGIEAGANNYAHPATHPASMIEGLGDAAVKNTGTTAGTVAAGDHNHDGTYQPTGNYLTSESDPTVPAWAKAATKPAYTAEEVGADASGSASAVQANLTAHENNTEKHITSDERTAWNSKADGNHNHDGVYLKPSNILAGANVSISTSGNDVTISSVGGGGGDIPLINNLTTETPGQGALDAAQGKILNDGKADVNHTHTKEQVGLSNVDNTSDADKPVSTATQTALNGISAPRLVYDAALVLDSNGGIRKTDGGTSWVQGQAYLNCSYQGACGTTFYLESVAQANNIFIGLTASPAFTDSGYVMDYSIYANVGVAEVWENGVQVPSYQTTLTFPCTLSVIYTGTKILYVINNEVLYERSAGSYLQLYGKIAIYMESDTAAVRNFTYYPVDQGTLSGIWSSLNGHTGNQSNPHNVTAEQVGAVPVTRTVNGKALSSDITISASEVGADAAGSAAAVQANLTSHTGNQSNPHNVTAAQVGAVPLTGTTMTGSLKAMANAAVSTAQVRNIYAGTADMTAGSSTLATGTVYLVYE